MATDAAFGLRVHTSPNPAWIFSRPVEADQTVYRGDLVIAGTDLTSPGSNADSVARAEVADDDKVKGVSIDYAVGATTTIDRTSAYRVRVIVDPNQLYVIQVDDSVAALAATDVDARFNVYYSGAPSGEQSNMELNSTIDNTDGQLQVLDILEGPRDKNGYHATFGEDFCIAVVRIHPDAFYAMP